MPTAVDSLKRSVDRLSREATELRAEIHARTLLLWKAICIGSVILVIGSLAVWRVTLDNRTAISINNYKLCPMLEMMIPRPSGSQPTTARGKEVTTRAVQLYKDYGCQKLKDEQ